MCLQHFYYLFLKSLIFSSCCVKYSKNKKDTRSATTNFGKEEVLKTRLGILGTLNIIKRPEQPDTFSKNSQD